MRKFLDQAPKLNALEHQSAGDPEILTRIAQYELAFRMQASVPAVMDISQAPQHLLDLYGAKPGFVSPAADQADPRTFYKGDDPTLANNCPLARRLAEAGLISDLKQRGMFEHTLIVWGGEFGRTPMMQNNVRDTLEKGFIGRDHHPYAFTMWLAGGGITPGLASGATDDIGHYLTENPVGIRDLQATILRLLGFDPYRFSDPFQGIDNRLIGPTDEGRVVEEIMARQVGNGNRRWSPPFSLATVESRGERGRRGRAVAALWELLRAAGTP